MSEIPKRGDVLKQSDVILPGDLVQINHGSPDCRDVLGFRPGEVVEVAAADGFWLKFVDYPKCSRSYNGCTFICRPNSAAIIEIEHDLVVDHVGSVQGSGSTGRTVIVFKGAVDYSKFPSGTKLYLEQPNPISKATVELEPRADVMGKVEGRPVWDKHLRVDLPYNKSFVDKNLKTGLPFLIGECDSDKLPKITDALENILIAHSMGWDLEGVIAHGHKALGRPVNYLPTAGYLQDGV